MKTNENQIIFIHRSGSGQKIVVEDQESAIALEQALNQFQESQWIRAAALPPAITTPPKFFSLKEFKVILVCGRASFRSASRKLSNAAMVLKAGVPSSFFGQECIAYISNANTSDQIELSCTVHLDQNGESVLDFSRAKAAEFKMLEAWI